MWSKSTRSGFLSVLFWAHGCSAFVATSSGRTNVVHQFRPSSSVRRLRPDGFMGGDNLSGYNQYSDEYNVEDMEINEEMGGPLARVGLTPDGHPQGQPMIRMDASAPRHQTRPRSTVQGSGSRATWVSPDPYGTDEMNVHLGTAGRPLHANVEHWSGPNNSPSRMQLYSEDGGARPWITKFRTPTNVGSGVTQVRNTGPMEFPIEASVSATNSPERAAEIGATPRPAGQMTRPTTIHGGALKTFSFDHSAKEVYLEITSDGLPVHARVEIWQGPSNTKAIANIYTDHGLRRPWSALIPLPGYGASICILNVGPMAYPIKVSMDPPPQSAF